jgi:hypothetical protein
MPNLKPGSNYTFTHLVRAYTADPQNEEDAHFLLYRGDEILALCLRYKFNPKASEVWVGDAPAIAEWGARLASLKDKKGLPMFYSGKGRKLYTYKGDCWITGDTDDPNEVAKRKGPVPLSRIVFLKMIETPTPPTRS